MLLHTPAYPPVTLRGGNLSERVGLANVASACVNGIKVRRSKKKKGEKGGEKKVNLCVNCRQQKAVCIEKTRASGCIGKGVVLF